jgi:hypothetical protein
MAELIGESLDGWFFPFVFFLINLLNTNADFAWAWLRRSSEFDRETGDSDNHVSP